MEGIVVMEEMVSVREWAELCRCILISCCIGGGVWTVLRGLMSVDKEHGLEISGRVIHMLAVGSLVSAFCIPERIDGKECMLWILLMIYFLSCSVTDHQTCQVYDILQYAGVGAAGGLLLLKEADAQIGCSILVFALLQYFIFMRLYGHADGMAFLVAALALAALGYDINACLLHMIVSYLLLGAIQALHRNIGGKGRLKKPVPFLPYITVTFWGMLLGIFELTGM